MNNSTFKYSYLNFDNGRIKNEIITGVLPPSYASCSSLIFFPPWPSFSSRVFAFWQSSKRLNCCSTRYHIVLRNLSFSPFPRFENFSASVLSSVGSPPFATDVSITFHDFAPTVPSNCRSVYEYLARLDISFDAAFVVID